MHDLKVERFTTEPGAGPIKTFTKSAEKPRRSGRGWIGVGRAGLNAQAPNKTHAVPEPSMGEGPAEGEAPAFMPGRTSTLQGIKDSSPYLHDGRCLTLANTV